MWADCRALGMDDKALKDFFIRRAGVIPTEGVFFGSQGSGHMRFNFATRHENLLIALERINKALKEL